MTHVYRWMRGLVLLLLVAGAVSPVGAQAPAQPPGASPAAQDEFVPIDQLPAEDQLPAAPFLIGAYTAAWVLVFGYVWMLWRRLDRVQRELADARRTPNAPR